MKLKKNIYMPFIAAAMLFVGQSCQDLDDDPAFNYPEEHVPTENPMKLHISFDDGVRDQSEYRNINSMKLGKYIDEGIQGKAYQAAEGGYIISSLSQFSRDLVAETGSLTYSFWMNSEPNKNGMCLISIASKDQAQGNFDIWLENNGGTSDQAFFKGHMRTTYGGTAKNQWVDVGGTVPEGSARVNGVFGKWTHIVFRYDGTTSAFSIFKDGEPALLNRVFANFGPLSFDKKTLGGITLGAFAGQSGESSKVDSWQKVGTYLGQFDECRLYTEALSDAEIKKLFTEKK